MVFIQIVILQSTKLAHAFRFQAFFKRNCKNTLCVSLWLYPIYNTTFSYPNLPESCLKVCQPTPPYFQHELGLLPYERSKKDDMIHYELAVRKKWMVIVGEKCGNFN